MTVIRWTPRAGIHGPHPHRAPATVILGVLLAGIVAVAATFLGSGCRQSAGLAPDVIVCLVDALRADRVSSYGCERPTTPHIDELAASGVRFERAYAAAPWTLPSVASLFTGNFPTTHGAGVWLEERNDAGATALAPGTVTWAERLRKLGYSTRGRSSNAYLTLGCWSGFEKARTVPGSAEDLVDWAIEQVEGAPGRPLFLYLHFMDVHTKNDLPESFVNRFATPEAGPRTRDQIVFNSAIERSLSGEALGAFATHHLAIYDGAASYVDQQIGRLLRHYRRIRGGSNAYFVVTADHGEEMWDHAEAERGAYLDPRGVHGLGHGHALFEELLRVPLVVAGPGVAAGARIKTPVSLIDVAPTLLDALGVGPQVGGVTEGRSLLSALAGKEPPRIPIFAEQILYGHERRALVDVDDGKLIQALDPREKSLLFDLASDPKETKDQLSASAARAASLAAKLNGHFASLPKAGSFEATPIDDATAEALRGIGYAGAGGAAGGARATPASAPAKGK